MFVLTHWSDHKIEDVAQVIGEEGKGLLLAQLNFLADYTHLTLDYMQRAEQCGAKAFVVTVDQTGRSKKRDAHRLTAQGQSHVNK
jgi:isopentenyl diphosphate isomerase/L-lactate dehydrogenase-like FMN-dependent dehydrogenase